MQKKYQKTAKTRRETAVQGTNDSSVLSKSSSASLGYFNDPFIHLFCGKRVRRSPIINRGYYIRAKCIDMVIKHFLLENPGQKKQIISLGSGYDSLFFRLKHEGLLIDTVIVEMDFPDLVQKKLQIIQSKPELLQLLSPGTDFAPSTPHLALDSVDLKMVGMDICRVSELDSVLAACQVSFRVPTFFISEVVLTYINKTSTEQILKWAPSRFKDASFCLYEQINPTDAFGQIMVRHFEKIGSPLKCILDFPTEEAQRERFLALGWKQCETYDLNRIYSYALPTEERERVEGLEPFDEFEEWHSKCAHYILLLAHSRPQPCLFQAPTPLPRPICPVAQNIISLVPCKVFPEEALTTFKRFGHTTTLVGNRLVVVAGGFGVQAGQHQRMSDIGILDIWTGQASVAKVPKDIGREVARMYHSSFIDPDGRIQILGGRFSPSRTPETVLSLALKITNEERDGCEMQSVNRKDDPSCASCDGQASVDNTEESTEVDVEGASAVGKTHIHTENSQTEADHPTDISTAEESRVLGEIVTAKKGNLKESPVIKEAQLSQEDTQAKTDTLKVDTLAEDDEQAKADEAEAHDPGKVPAFVATEDYKENHKGIQKHTATPHHTTAKCKANIDVEQEAQTGKDAQTVNTDGSRKKAAKGTSGDGGSQTVDIGRIPVRTLWPVAKEQLAALYRDLCAYSGPAEGFQRKFEQFIHRNPPWESKMLEYLVAHTFHGDVGLCAEILPQLKHVPRPLKAAAAAPTVRVKMRTFAGPAPTQRSRQALVSFCWDGSAMFVLHGGINRSRKVLGDSHMYDMHENKWSQLSYGGDQPGRRHSHTLSFWKEDLLVMAGGLTKYQEPTNQVHLLSLSKRCWSRLDTSGYLLPRSGHFAHVKENLLFLVGGVQQHCYEPSIGVVSLDSGQATEINIPSTDEEGNLVLYYGMAGVALGSSHVLLVGGGSACFSFGSHLNQLYVVNLDPIAQLVKH